MKKLNIRWLVIVLLFSGLFMGKSDGLMAKTYYVATSGSDDYPGTLDSPWATIEKAIETAQAGDIVYIRGGVYYSAPIGIRPSDGYGNNGTSSNYIHYFNYPGESPIFDFGASEAPGNYITGFFLQYANFIHFKGLTIRNVEQKRDYVEAMGIAAISCSNLIFENMTVHDCGGNAFRYAGAMGYYGITYDSTYFINCDAYNNCDSRPRTTQGDPALGGAADGFKSWNEPGAYIEFRGCRAWNNSDDGFDPSADAVTVIENCWSFSNGYLDGDGTGFKTGGIYNDYGNIITRKVTNCIAAFNRATGFFLLEYADYYRTNARFYNNTAYANTYGFIFSRNATNPIVLGIWKNNIAYKNTGLPISNAYQQYTESNNTWDRVDGYPGYINSVEVAVNDSDFVSLNVEELKRPRNEDGPLPDVNFLRLANGSDLIDAGIDVNLEYFGKAPDIGAFEVK